MFLSVRGFAEHMTQLPRLEVKGFTLEFCVHSLTPESFRRFSLNFTQMFLSERPCAEPMTKLSRLKVKVTLQDHVIYPSIRVRSISPKPLDRFSLNFSQMFLLVRQCAEHMTQLPRLKVTGQGQDLPLNFV